MQIACPNCATAYQVEASALGPEGRSVRCARCRTMWIAVPEAESAPGLVPGLVIIEPNGASPLPAQARAWQGEDDEPAARSFAFEEAGDGIRDSATSLAVHSDLSVDASATHGRTKDEVAPPNGGQASDRPAHVEASPSLVPDGEPTTADETGSTNPDELLAERRARRAQIARARRRQRMVPNLPVIIIMLTMVTAILIGWRSDIVRLAPQLASFYAGVGLPVNLRGLAFEDIKTEREMQDGIAVLVVTGDIVNVARESVSVPRLRFAIRNASDGEIYSWTAMPVHSVLAPHEKIPFRTRLASPPPEGRKVQVRFFNKRDAVVGMR